MEGGRYSTERERVRETGGERERQQERQNKKGTEYTISRDTEGWKIEERKKLDFAESWSYWMAGEMEKHRNYTSQL